MKSLYFFDNDAGVRAPGLLNSVKVIREAIDRAAPLLEQGSENSDTEQDSMQESGQKQDEDPHPMLKNYSGVAEICRTCKSYAEGLLEQGHVPVLVAGDHSIGMGSVAATASYYDDLTVVWVDAHADINTEKTTPSGNIHGMPLASLLGIGSPELNRLSGQHHPIRPENLIYLGLRDLDPGEVETLKHLPAKAYWFEDIKREGLAKVLEGLKTSVKTKNIHLSIDLDSMDPDLVPGVSVPVPGGFTPDEVLDIVRFFQANFDVRAYDLVEYNACLDSEEKSLKVALRILQQILTYTK
jgi:arginase